MKRTRLRPVSKKRAARNREYAQFRRDLFGQVDTCEACGHHFFGPKTLGSIWWRQECHHIAQGIHRGKALTERCAVLVACKPCHDDELSSRAKWPIARQLAALKRSRPDDYNLAAFNDLRRGAPRISEEEVEAWNQS